MYADFPFTEIVVLYERHMRLGIYLISFYLKLSETIHDVGSCLNSGKTFLTDGVSIFDF